MAGYTTPAGRRLLLIVGAPRSGTTWLHMLLTRSPAIASAFETHLFSGYMRSNFERWRSWAADDHVMGLHRLIDEAAYFGLLQSRYALIRLGFVLAMAISTLTVLASYSRGALLGLVAVAFVFWLKSKRKIASLVAVCVVLSGGLALMPEKWWERMNSLKDIHQDKSAEGRLYIWRVAWTFFQRHPFTGIGFHATDYHNVIDLVVPGGNVHEIHSIWLQMLAEQGIFVFLIWVGMIAYGAMECRRLAKIARSRPEFSWAADLARMGQISILAYLVTGTFLPISSWDVFFTILVTLSAARLVVVKQIAAQGRVAEPVPPRRFVHPLPAMGRAPQHARGTP